MTTGVPVISAFLSALALMHDGGSHLRYPKLSWLWGPSEMVSNHMEGLNGLKDLGPAIFTIGTDHDRFEKENGASIVERHIIGGGIGMREVRSDGISLPGIGGAYLPSKVFNDPVDLRSGVSRLSSDHLGKQVSRWRFPAVMRNSLKGHRDPVFEARDRDADGRLDKFNAGHADPGSSVNPCGTTGYGVGLDGKCERTNNPENANRAEDGADLCPQGRVLGGPRCLPLGTQIGFVCTSGIIAWLSIFHGLGLIGKGRFRSLFVIGGVAVGLIPFFFGIV
ncbi:hypothetical protein [Sphingomonas sp. Root710]|uniref:hypothetical protein n=1 Tax=Sphingomonas sp. Root710 TaxID=1736594 RepID=UPI0012E3B84F|nr:hypothetical protein [Sphingomonas sp. Root710]